MKLFNLVLVILFLFCFGVKAVDYDVPHAMQDTENAKMAGLTYIYGLNHLPGGANRTKAVTGTLGLGIGAGAWGGRAWLKTDIGLTANWTELLLTGGSVTSVNLIDATTPAFDLVLSSDGDGGSVMSADRDLIIDAYDADRNIDLQGDLDFQADVTTVGAFATGAAFTTVGIVSIADAFATVGAFGLTITVDDAASSILLDEQTLAIVGEGTATRLMTLENGTDAPATLELNGILSAIDQNVQVASDPEFNSVQLTDGTTAAFTVSIVADGDGGTVLDADRDLIVDTYNADRDIDLQGDIDFQADVTTVGAFETGAAFTTGAGIVNLGAAVTTVGAFETGAAFTTGAGVVNIGAALATVGAFETGAAFTTGAGVVNIGAALATVGAFETGAAFTTGAGVVNIGAALATVGAFETGAAFTTVGIVDIADAFATTGAFALELASTEATTVTIGGDVSLSAADVTNLAVRHQQRCILTGADITGAATFNCGAELPDDAIVWNSYCDIDDTFVGLTDDDCTIAFSSGEGANDLITATAISAGDSWDGPALVAGVPVGNIANAIKLTDARQPIFTVALGGACTGLNPANGSMTCFIDYDLGR